MKTITILSRDNSCKALMFSAFAWIRFFTFCPSIKNHLIHHASIHPITHSIIPSHPFSPFDHFHSPIHRPSWSAGRIGRHRPDPPSLYSRIASCRPHPQDTYTRIARCHSHPPTCFLFEIAMSSSAFIILPSSAGNATNVCAWWKVAVISTGHSNGGSRS